MLSTVSTRRLPSKVLIMNQRLALLWVWIAGYVICVGLLFSMFIRGLSVLGNLPTHFTLLSSIYAPYIGTIFGYWFSKKGSVVTADTDSRQQFLVAVAMSILFQAVVIGILTSTFFDVQRGGIENALKIASQVATVIAVLAAAPIGYFFGKEKS